MTDISKLAQEGGPDFSFVFITSNRCDQLLTAIGSVRRALPPNTASEIVVVDNASSDGTLAVVTEAFPETRQVRLEKNIGVAAGRNIGAAHALGRVLIFMDDDAELETPDLLAILSDRLAVHPKVAAVAFKIINARANQVLSHELPMRHYRPDLVETERQVSYFIGCGFAMEKATFEALGGFDEDLFYALEEVEFSYRLLDAGHEILYCPAIVVRHKTPPEVRRKGPWYFHFIRSRILMVLRDLPYWAAVPHLLIWHTFLAVQSLRSGFFGAFARGAWDGWRGARAALAKRRAIRNRTAWRIWTELSGRIFY